MKKHLILYFLLFISCNALKNERNIVGDIGKIKLYFSNGTNDINLNGIAFVSKDSCFFNIFGPLGINVAKIKVVGDSINIVDLHNKIIYNSSFFKLSGSIQRLFNGEFNENEKKLICSINHMIDKSFPKKNCLYNENGSELNYNIKGFKKKEIKIVLNTKELKYLLKMEYSPGNNINVKSFDISKYNYDHISISLQ